MVGHWADRKAACWVVHSAVVTAALKADWMAVYLAAQLVD